MSLSNQPNEEPMRNKERKAEMLPLARHKAKTGTNHYCSSSI